MKNYYQVFEISPNATQAEIKKQYHLLLHAWHPDKFSTPEQKAKADEKLKEINEAYQILSDQGKRADYDRRWSAQSSWFEEDNQRRREQAETERQRAEYERQQREQEEAKRRRSEYERQQREQAEANKLRAEYEQQQKEQAEAERRRRNQKRRRQITWGAISLIMVFIVIIINNYRHIQTWLQPSDYETGTIIAKMSEGLSAPASGGGIWYGPYEYLTFSELDRDLTLEVSVLPSPGLYAPLAIELWEGKINPNDHSWWNAHVQVILTPLTYYPYMQWQIIPGTYTLFLAGFSADGTVSNNTIVYNLHIVK